MIVMIRLFVISLFGLLFSSATLSETLPKEWVGSISHNNVGYGGKYNSDQQSSNKLQYHSYNEPRSLTILEQDGQSLRLLYKADAISYTLIGTLSANGKEMAVANETSFAVLNVEPDRIIGCGSSRGGKPNPSYGQWKQSYATWCVDFRPAR